MNPTTETTLRFTGDWQTLPVFLAAFGLAALMWFIYRRELKFHGGRFVWLPAMLRSLAVFVLVLALASPVLRHVTTQRQLGRVVIAVDASASMNLTDDSKGADGATIRSAATRYQRAQNLLFSGAQPLIQRLAENQDVELVLLRGQQTQRVWWWRQGGKDTSGDMPKALDLRADAPITNLDQAVRDALGPATAGTALVLLSDGQHNTPGSPEELASALKSTHTPVFAVGFGTEIAPADLAILDVQAPESVFTEETVQGRIAINDTMPAGITATVQIESEGKKLWERSFITEGRGERRFDYAFMVKALPPAPAAERDKTLRLLSIQVAAQGERAALEKTRFNNVREIALHLLTRKRKILVLDGRPRWETRYVHNHFDRDDRWQATLLFDDFGDPGYIAKEFPKTRDELLTYDLILLGDVATGRFKPEQLDWIMEFVEKRGGGLILVDGARGHLQSWAKGRTASLIPVDWHPGASKDLAWNVQLAPDGERQAALRLSDSASANALLWPSLPPVQWMAPVVAQSGAVTLANFTASKSSSKAAISAAMVYRPMGAGVVLYLATDDFWRWRYQVADLYHQRLWMQLGSWVAAPPFQAEDKRMALGTDRLRYASGESSEIRVRLRNSQGGIVKDAQPRAFLLHEGKEIATLLLDPDAVHLGVYRALTPPLKPGSYEIAVSESPSAPRSDLHLSLRVADSGNAEWATLTMNRPMLETMATNSGGRFLREEQAAAELPNLLQTLDQKQTITRETLLWSSWWWFGLVMLLLTAEWLLRKRLRLV